MGPTVKVDTSSMSWWKNAKMGWDETSVSIPADTSVSALALIPENSAKAAAREPSNPIVAKKTYRKTAAHGSQRRLGAISRSVSIAASHSPLTMDRVVVSQAQKQAISPILPVLDASQERAEMQRVRSALRLRVRLAFLDVREIPTANLASRTISDVVAVETPVAQAPVKASVRRSHIASSVVASKTRSHRHQYTIRGLAKYRTLNRPSATASDGIVSSQAKSDKAVASQQTTDYPSHEGGAERSTEEPLPSGQITISGAGQSRVIETGSVRAPASATQGLSFGVTSQTLLAMNTQQALPSRASGGRPTGKIYSVADQVDTQDTQKTTDAAQKGVSSHKMAARVPGLVQFQARMNSTRPSYVEAFQWLDPVFGVEGEVVSNEGTAEGMQKHWVQVNANDHWPTLSLSQNPSLGDSVPLISENNLRLLEGTSGIKISHEGGIVFGRLPRDVSLAFSGRAENRSVFTDKESDQYQDFILLNVEPGAHVLHLSLGLDKGAVAVPVRPGVATYVDLTNLEVHGIEGSVITGDDNSGKGLSGIRVSVVGQTGDPVKTDSSGAFTVPGVLVAEGHPVYLETDASEGHTHRYAVGAAAWTTQATLYRFSSRRIEGLTQQLEGGVSSDSGLILGVFPKIAGQTEGEAFFPSVRSLEAGASLTPETYTLDSEDRMLVNTPLSTEAPRFAAAQIPAGTNLLHVEDKSQRLRWSQLVISSPGVINVVNP